MKEKLVLEKQDWRKEAKDIAEEAFATYGKNDEAAREFIYEHAWNCYCLSYTNRAYAVVFDAGDNNDDVFCKDVFYRAGEALMDTGHNAIYLQNDETFDDVVFRMAYWVVVTKATDYYDQLVKGGIIND